MAAAAAEGGRVRSERRGAGTRPARPPSPPAAPAPPPPPPSRLRGSGTAALLSGLWGSPSENPFVSPGTDVPSQPSPHSHPLTAIAPRRPLREARVSARGNGHPLPLRSPRLPSGQSGPGTSPHVTKRCRDSALTRN
nr:formin-like protein 18 [Taeniopygia guttata]